MLLVLAATTALGLGLQVLPYRIDDAFITFRYARNFAQGHGVVWNLAGPAVEGFTSPLWFLALSAASAWFGSELLPSAATILGCASLFACLVLAAQAGPALGAAAATKVAQRVLPLVLLCTLAPAVYYAVTGLETMLFLCVALLYIMAVLGELPLWLGLGAGFAACWVRPEAPWLLACQLAALLAAREPVSSRRSLALAGSIIAGSACLLAVRYAVFGALMPNTFYAKRPVLQEGAHYVLNVTSSSWASLLLVLGALGAFFGTTRDRGLGTAALVWLGAPLLEGGDWMSCGRFVLPALGLACLASAGALHGAPGRVRNAAVLSIAVAALAANVAALRELAALARSDLESIVHEQLALTEWLRSSHARSVALVDIGELGYRTSLDVIDLAGLTDPAIAHAPGAYLHKTGVAQYVLGERRPDAIILRVNGSRPRDDARVLREVPRFAIEPVERDLARDPRLRTDYELLFAAFPADLRDPFYGRVLYVRRDLALPASARPQQRILYLPPLRL